MKNIIIILSALFLIGCSKDDVPADPTTSCNCTKLYERRVITTASDTGWVSYGVNPETTDIKDCTQNGKLISSDEFSSPTQVIKYRRILSCK